MSKGGKGKGIFIAAIIWVIMLAGLGAAYKFLIVPLFSDKLDRDTGSQSQYDHTVTVAMDSFSGYSVLRSPALRDQLKAKKIRLDFKDDGADYQARIKALKSGKTQMAVFTIDSFIMSSVRLGDFPASIVLVLDETKGADAVVAYKDGVASIRDLDDPDARIVLTPSSPSEFLARIVLANFSLPRLPAKWMVEEDGAEDVYKKFRAADKSDKRAYALWEPFVSKALEETGAHVLIDSSQLKGYIVDVLVAERGFLREKPEVVAAVVESYLRAGYSYSSRDDALIDLVSDDAKEFGGGAIKASDAKKLVEGIQWKNTLENYAHFGLVPASEAAGVQHLEDMIENIVEVLVKTDALDANPVEGKANTLYYDAALRDLHAADFHPGTKINILKGPGVPDNKLADVRKDAALPSLSASQWENLIPVGQLQVKPIAFARGTARINIQSRRELEGIAKTLKSFPAYYLIVTGHARAEGDLDANMALALERAQTAAQELNGMGLSDKRIKAVAAKPSEEDGTAQSVSFVVGQAAY